MMANPTLIQKQIKENTEDLHNFVRDLKHWEEDMKRKDRQLSNDPNEEPLPPIRKPRYSEKPKIVKDEKNEKKRIKSSDYKAWEQFDVAKACEEIDNENESSSEDSEDEKDITPQEDETYLKERALYDKELGNQHCKNGKWDEAIDCYTRAITNYPKDPVFWANRAQCYLMKREYSRVEQDCTQSLKRDSTYVKAFMRRATAREALGFLSDARSDLIRVLQLEPNNGQARRQLDKVKSAAALGQGAKRKEYPEKKLNKQPEGKASPNRTTTVKPTETLVSASTSNQIDINNIDIKLEKQDNIEYENPTETLASASTSNQIDINNIDIKLEKQDNIEHESKWDLCDNIVEPIMKPPHLRSKKTLKRIEIHDVGLNAPKHTCARKLTQSKDLPIVPTTEKESSLQNSEPKPRSVHTLPSAPVEMTFVPPPPKTSVQFHLAWNSIKDNKPLCYQFLKQIPGKQLPDIFKDSLESKMFSNILQVLATEFVAVKEPVLPYLRGLSGVRRFSTLALFMTSQDKSCLSGLFDYCSDRKECALEELTQLKTLYEIS